MLQEEPGRNAEAPMLTRWEKARLFAFPRLTPSANVRHFTKKTFACQQPIASIRSTIMFIDQWCTEDLGFCLAYPGTQYRAWELEKLRQTSTAAIKFQEILLAQHSRAFLSRRILGTSAN